MVTLKVACDAAFSFYILKFLSKLDDKNLRNGNLILST
ncbi:hypothetical protein J2Z65_006366 [Paenibacillus aceris]|uniref:Uncharacterized protein n=1 Tax=Paenibacillus aceris TaxID=869555 RepID=A0ABS4I836_9BACL|nr:hypothetical protein [Paenibacillus aceris]